MLVRVVQASEDAPAALCADRCACMDAWPVVGDLHEAAWLFILLSSLPYSFLSSSRADPSKMHFRWRRDSLLGASNIHQVCFYWLQEHTDDGKADWLLRSAGLGSPQMLVAVLQLQKRRKAAFPCEREMSALPCFSLTVFICLTWDAWALHGQGVPHWVF